YEACTSSAYEATAESTGSTAARDPRRGGWEPGAECVFRSDQEDRAQAAEGCVPAARGGAAQRGRDRGGGAPVRRTADAARADPAQGGRRTARALCVRRGVGRCVWRDRAVAAAAVDAARRAGVRHAGVDGERQRDRARVSARGVAAALSDEE